MIEASIMRWRPPPGRTMAQRSRSGNSAHRGMDGRRFQAGRERLDFLQLGSQSILELPGVGAGQLDHQAVPLLLERERQLAQLIVGEFQLYTHIDNLDPE